MGRTKEKLARGEVTLGGWVMIGHPTVAEVLAGEGFDWIGVDLEHTSTDLRAFHQIALALKGTACDLLARLHSCDPVLAKLVLDAGADGIIVPSVNTAEEARRAVSMAKYPPQGIRGAALCRAADFGRNFEAYYRQHNDRVIVVVMLEHIQAVENADAILAVPGIDAALIGPYDLSASMGMPGHTTAAEALDAQMRILEACRRHHVPPGIHVVAVDPGQLQARIEQGFRFIPCGLDTEFLIYASRQMLRGIHGHG